MLEVLGRTFLHGVYGDPKDWGWDWAVSPASGISGVFLLAAQGSRLSRARLAFLHFNRFWASLWSFIQRSRQRSPWICIHVPAGNSTKTCRFVRPSYRTQAYILDTEVQKEALRPGTLKHLEDVLLLGPKPAVNRRMLLCFTLYSLKLHSAQRSRRS